MNKHHWHTLVFRFLNLSIIFLILIVSSITLPGAQENKAMEERKNTMSTELATDVFNQIGEAVLVSI